MATVFDGNDIAYRDWLVANPDGYVLNSWRTPSPSYIVLHRSGCTSVNPATGNTKPGGFTERRYIKVCSSQIAELQQWARKHGRLDGSFSVQCSKCSRPNPKV